MRDTQLAEIEFRKSEKVLDSLLDHDKDKLISQSIEITDHSARSYHYKNQLLIWTMHFRKEWLVGIERASITVYLQSGEPVNPGSDVAKVSVQWRAELYQTGRDSRINEQKESVYQLTEVEKLGIAALVSSAIREAEECLPKAA